MIKFGDCFIDEKSMPQEIKKTFDKVIRDYRFNWANTSILEYISSNNLLKKEDLQSTDWLKLYGVVLLPNGVFATVNDEHRGVLTTYLRKEHPFDYEQFKLIPNESEMFFKDTGVIKVNTDYRRNKLEYNIMAAVTKQQLSTIYKTNKEIDPDVNVRFLVLDKEGIDKTCHDHVTLLKILREFGYLQDSG